jgi:hypothetical protein
MRVFELRFVVTGVGVASFEEHVDFLLALVHAEVGQPCSAERGARNANFARAERGDRHGFLLGKLLRLFGADRQPINRFEAILLLGRGIDGDQERW